MAPPRSPIFDGVNPALLEAIQRVAGAYGPHAVTITSGKREGLRPSFHNTGNALDVQLSDKTTGQALANYQDPTHAKAYQAFANAVRADMLKNNPELAGKLRWGGYFGGQRGNYGALDLMHFDIGGGPGGKGMLGGSWESGWTPEMLKYWGMDAPGGSGPAAISAEQARKAFLTTLARGEAPGYDTLYGGGRFTDFSKHPGQMVTAAGRTSDAAGRYQFLGSTWAEQAAKHGYKDFSPETQDAAAWNYAAEVYKSKTGRDLQQDLMTRDPALHAGVGTALKEIWPSLPGGSQESPYWAKNKVDFATDYLNALGGDTAAAATSAKAAPAAAAAQSAATPPSSVGAILGDAAKDAGKAFTGLGGGLGGASSERSKESYTVAPGLMQQALPITPLVDPQAAAAQRQQLAAIMQRLNTGRLF